MIQVYRTIPTLSPADIIRFWSKVAVPNKNGCKLWQEAPDPEGYGRFYLKHNGKTKSFRAHRVAYFIYSGQQPGQLMVCHDCPNEDNRACVEQTHLFSGTALDNNRDAKNKGRMATGDRHGSHTHPERWRRGDNHWSRMHPEERPRGEGHGKSKLTVAGVIEIRRCFKARELTSYQLADKFKVGQFAIMSVVHRKTWKHVE